MAAVVLAVSAVSDRLHVPAPLLLVVVGAVASYLPGLPTIRLESEVVLLGLLPPLLYAAAIQTSLVDFNANRGTILRLSVLLVVVTACTTSTTPTPSSGGDAGADSAAAVTDGATDAGLGGPSLDKSKLGPPCEAVPDPRCLGVGERCISFSRIDPALKEPRCVTADPCEFITCPPDRPQCSIANSVPDQVSCQPQ